MKRIYIVLMIHGMLCAESISNQEFAQVVTEFIKKKATRHHKPAHTIFDTWWYEKMALDNVGMINYVMFNASDMYKEKSYPDTLLKDAENDITIQAWKMLPSDKRAQKVNVTFGFPDHYDSTKPIIMYLYLLAQGLNERSCAANIGISINAIAQPSHINLVWRGNTDNFLIMKSSNVKDVSLLIVQLIIPPLIIKPKSLVNMQIHRVMPAGMVEEYGDDLYLESIILAYNVKH